jgi:tRNA threonylcarbamoyladenosine biosynthesis protein TsaB
MSGRLVLVLDASTYLGSVAVIRGGRVMAEREAAMRGERVERLMPAVAEALEEAAVQGRELDAIACGGGPGSFTSLRIAGSIAKGLATGWGKPLLAVPSLLLMVAAHGDASGSGRYLAAMDALRGEIFAGLIEIGSAGYPVQIGETRRIPRQSLEQAAAAARARLVGVVDGAVPLAKGLAWLATWAEQLRPVDLASWEPEYGRAAEAQVRWEAIHGKPLPGR